MKDLFAKFIPTLNVYNDSRPSSHLNKASQGFPDSPRVKNLPCNAGHVSSIHCWGIKVPQHTEQLTPIPQLLRHMQQRKIRVTHEDSAANIPHAVTETDTAKSINTMYVLIKKNKQGSQKKALGHGKVIRKQMPNFLFIFTLKISTIVGT